LVELRQFNLFGAVQFLRNQLFPVIDPGGKFRVLQQDAFFRPRFSGRAAPASVNQAHRDL
jgi:hypothetical protein